MGNTKIITEGKRYIFLLLRSQEKKINMDQMLSASGDYVATINDKTWYIGHMAAKESRFAIRALMMLKGILILPSKHVSHRIICWHRQRNRSNVSYWATIIVL